MGNVKQGALTVVGAVGGFFLGGPKGALYGAQMGYSIGASTLNTQLPTQKGPRIDDLQQQVSGYGIPLGKAWGTTRRAGVVIWAPDIQETEHTQTVEQGGKGSPKVTQQYETYTYAANFAVAFNDGEIDAVRRIWFNDKIVYDDGGVSDYGTLTDDQLTDWIGSKSQGLGDGVGSITIYKGTETQEPDPTIESVEGVGEVPAFRGVAYIVVEDLQLEAYGNRRPQVLIEFIRTNTDTSTSATTVKTVDFSTVGYASSQEWGACSAIDNDGTAHVFIRQRFTDWLQYYKVTPSGNISYQSGVEIGTTESSVGISGELPLYSPVLPGATPEGEPLTVYEFGGDIVDGGLFSFELNGAGLTIRGPLSICHVGNRQRGTYALFEDTTAGGADTIRVFDYTKGYEISIGLLASTYIAFNSRDITVVTGAKLSWILSESYIYIILTSGSIYQYDHQGTELNNWNLGLGAFTKQSMNPSCVDSDDETIVYFSNASQLVKFETLTATVTTYDGIMTTPTILIPNRLRVKNGIVFEERRENINYISLEDRTKTGESLSNIITELCEDSGLSTSQIDVTALTGISVPGFQKVDGSATAAIEALFTAYNVSAYEDENKIIFRLRNNAVDKTITASDLACAVDTATASTLPYSRVEDGNLPRAVNINFIDYSNGYALGSQSVQRVASLISSNQILTIELPIVMTANEARRIAERVLNNFWSTRVDYEKISLPLQYADIVPTDILSVTVDGVAHEIRATTVTISDIVEVTGISNSIAAQSSDVTGETNTIPYEGSGYGGPTELYFLDIPPLRNQDSDIGYYIGAHGYFPGWRGAQIYAEESNGGYSKVASLTSAITAGVTTETLGDGVTSTIDYINEIYVTMRNGTLTGTTKAGILADSTLNVAAVGTQGRWEIIQFINVVDNGDGSYILSGLLRGLGGTEHNTGNHVFNDVFVLLEASKLRRANTNDINQRFNYRAVTFNNVFQSGVDVQQINTGESIKPLAPVHVRQWDVGSGNRYIRWKRRGRTYGEWADIRNVPLGEASEEYTIELYQSDGTTLVSSTTASDTDFVIIAASVGQKVRVAQNSEFYGPGEYSELLEIV